MRGIHEFSSEIFDIKSGKWTRIQADGNFFIRGYPKGGTLREATIVKKSVYRCRVSYVKDLGLIDHIHG